MSKAEDKFKRYLEEKLIKEFMKYSCEKDIIDNANEEIICMSNLKKIFELTEEEYIKNNILFNDYEQLSLILENSKLNTKEKFEIIMTIIERTIKVIQNNEYLNISDYEITIITSEILQKFKSKDNENQILFNKLLKEDKIGYFLQKEILSEKEQELRNEIYEYAVKNKTDHTRNKVEQYKIIYDKYFKNKNILSEEDIEKILIAMKKLDITDKMIDTVKFILIKKLKKQLEPEPKLILSPTKEKKETKYLNEAEYKLLKNKLLEYYNPRTNEYHHSLSENEIISTAAILIKLGYEKKYVEQFLYSTYSRFNFENKEEILNQNPLTKYVKNYEKIVHYADKLNYIETIDLINECMQMMFITDDENYKFWKDEVKHLIIFLMDKLNNYREFELEKSIEKSKEIKFYR